MPQSCSSIRCCNLGLHIPGRAKGGPLEEPAAVILHGGVSEGGGLAAPWGTYTGTKLETVDTAKENLQLSGAPLLGTRPWWPSRQMMMRTTSTCQLELDLLRELQ